MTDRDAELGAIVAMLTEAGHIIVMGCPMAALSTSSQTGIRVGRQPAMSRETDQDALLAALLDAQA